MKRIFFIFVIFLFLLGFSAPVLAANRPQSNVVLSKDQVVNNDYFAGGGTVNIHGTINGDAYIAGGDVFIDGTINGDLIAAGGTIIVEGNITHNVRAVGGNVVINNAKIGGNVSLGGGNVTLGDTSELAGSLVAGAGQLQLLGPVGKEINVAAGKVLISNVINGNATVRTNELDFSQAAVINGNLTYWSNQKANISQGATVSGTIKQIPVPKYNANEIRQGAMAAFSGFKIFFGIVGFIASFIIGLFLIYLLPLFTKNVATVIKKRFWLSLGIGVLAGILTPIIFIVLLITLIGIPIAFVFIFIMLLLLYFGKIYISYVIGEKIFGEKKTAKAWILLVGLLVFSIVTVIPVIGGIFQGFAIVTGLGALLISERDYFLLLRTKKLV